ncbi:MAG: hypothetical protein ACTSYI_08430 [Promethearchaeota archaeon]
MYYFDPISLYENYFILNQSSLQLNPMFNRSKSNAPTKMPTRKNDAAPMLFFIDQIQSSSFDNPILPMPLRIDRILTKRSSLFIFPSKRAIIQVKDKYFTFDYGKIYILFLENLLKYAEQKYRTLFYRQIDLRLVNTWWNLTKDLASRIHGFGDLQAEILQSYLDAYQQYLQGKDEKEALIEHIDHIIKYCNEQVEQNSIQVDYKGKTISKRLYKKKSDRIFPDIYEVDIYNTLKQKTNRKAFVPLFVYDDLLDCYLYNKLQLDPEGFNAMEDVITPEELAKQEKAKQPPKLFRRSSKSDVKKDDDESEDQPPEEVHMISFSSLEEEGIIIPYQDSMGTDLDGQEILGKINIEEIFFEII